MFPRSIVNNSVHVSRAYSKQLGKFSLVVWILVKRSNLFNGDGCKLRESVFLSNALPALRDHIARIVGVSSKKKMVRVHARPIVAAMKNAHAFRDNPIVNDPRNYVNTRGTVFSFPSTHAAISSRELASNPVPARFSFLDSIPKSVLKVFGKALCFAGFFGNVILHNKFVLLCRAPGCWFNAGASSFRMDFLPNMSMKSPS